MDRAAHLRERREVQVSQGQAEPSVSLCVPVPPAPWLRACCSGWAHPRLVLWDGGCWFLTQERAVVVHAPSLGMRLVPLQPARSIHQVTAQPRASPGGPMGPSSTSSPGHPASPVPSTRTRSAST